MASYTASGTYTPTSGTTAYRLNIEARTSQVTGGTLVECYAAVTMTRNPGTPAFGTANRSWTLPGGRDTSVTGTPNGAGSSTLSYAFTTTVPNTVVFYNYFNQYIPYSYGTTTKLTMTVDGGGSSTFFTSRTLSVDVPLFSAPVTTYTLSYNANGGNSTPSGGTYSSGASWTAAAAISRTGYVFSSWYGSDGNYYYPGNSYTMPASNLTLTASWSVNSFTINYNSNNGTISGSGSTSSSSANYPSTSLTISSSSFTPPTGYGFGGWSTSQDNTLDYSPGNSYSFDLSSSSGSTTLYAIWTPQSPVFSDTAPYITTTSILAKNVNTNSDYSVSASPVSSYSIFYSGSGLDPTSWLSINSSGQLSGIPPQIGVYTFKIRATNSSFNTDTSEISMTVLPAGKKMSGSNTSTSLSLAKRFDGTNWVNLKVMKRYNGSTWIDISNI